MPNIRALCGSTGASAAAHLFPPMWHGGDASFMCPHCIILPECIIDTFNLSCRSVFDLSLQCLAGGVYHRMYSLIWQCLIAFYCFKGEGYWFKVERAVILPYNYSYKTASHIRLQVHSNDPRARNGDDTEDGKGDGGRFRRFTSSFKALFRHHTCLKELPSRVHLVVTDMQYFKDKFSQTFWFSRNLLNPHAYGNLGEVAQLSTKHFWAPPWRNSVTGLNWGRWGLVLKSIHPSIHCL